MIKLADYCKTWRLQPSVIKTVTSLFHLHHTSATQELNVYLNDWKVKHEVEPIYLGLTLDCTLSYHAHLKKTAAKVKTRNNLLSKLAGSFGVVVLQLCRCQLLPPCIQWQSTAHQLESIITHQIGGYAVTGCHAHHLWHPVSDPTLMASSSEQYRSSSYQMRGCHWQVTGESTRQPKPAAAQ